MGVTPRQSTFIRGALWATAVFNGGAAALFAFPDSALGRLAELPLPLPGIYRAFLAFFVLLLGALYAGLALQPIVHRPLLAFLAIGKIGAFLIVLIAWFNAAASIPSVAAACGDLLFATVFIIWLRRTVPIPRH